MKKLVHKTLFIFGYTLFSIVFPFSSIQVSAKDIQTINNLVVFAQFDDVQDYNFMEQYTNDIISMCNDTSIQHSLKSYINTISYGKADTNSYFPQMQNDTIIPYQLKQSKEDYMNSELLAIEVLSNLDIPTDMDLDANNDNIIDNIILVVDGEATTMDDILWAKAFYLGGLEINGLSTGYVNIHNSFSLFEGIISGGVGVICHEFLHSLGYPDLYRNSSTEGVPVGTWDIMASNSIFLQYPLAYQRSKISNWLESTEITQDGSYTLKSVNNNDGNRLYILKTPLSDTEFFALEYRVQGAKYSDEMDTKIYGTGLVVYRINTQYNGNYKYTNDGIYVFRPNETSLGAGNGDISLSCYGGENAPNEVGSLNLQDDISKGALVYSNGLNSGIKISDISINGDEVNFNIQFADISNVPLWKSVSNNFENVSCLDMVSYNDIPYILTSNGFYANVSYKYNDDWISIGDSFGSGNYGSVNNSKITICNGTPYVIFNDYDYNLNLYAYDNTNNSWNLLYHGDSIAQYTDITSNNDTLYIAYTTGSYPYRLNVLSYDIGTNSIDIIGSNLSENACNISISYSNDTLLVAYRDLNDNNIPKLLTYNSNSWNSQNISNDSCSIVSTDENLVMTIGSSSRVYKFQDDSLNEILLPNIDGSIFDAVPLIKEDSIYLAINTQNPTDFFVYNLNDDSTEKLGNSLSQEVVNYPNLICSNNSLYVAYISNNALNIKEFPISNKDDIQNDNILGDLNLDNHVDYLDTLILKKHILNISYLTDTQKLLADLNNDSYINILDYICIKNMILNY